MDRSFQPQSIPAHAQQKKTERLQKKLELQSRESLITVKEG